jgi:prepilin-type N-terminal cleavage/methylation domain-containing protein/prepilin-type processing-associated H-X9-DG protein
MSCWDTTRRGNGRQADRLHRAAGFTLIELLAVIAIIGLLIGLLLPAVQAARESARRSICASTLRQWGQAIQRYEQSYGVLPLGFSEYRCKQHSWIPVLWPYMEQLPLADRYDWGRFFSESPNVTPLTAHPVGPMTQRLPDYYCPSDKPNAAYRSGNAVVPRVNYVVNATNLVVGGKKFRGPFHRQFQDGYASYCGPQSAGLSTGPGLSWVSMDARGYVGPWAWRFSHVVDGLSTTLMMAEAIVWPSEGVPGEPSDQRGGPAFAFFDARLTPNSAFDITASWFVPPTYSGCINSPPSLPCQATGGQDWIFASRSRHSAGVQTLMCDGSVRFTSDLVDQAAWQAQGTMSRREVPLSYE